MRTTILLDDDIHCVARSSAEADGISLSTVVNGLMRKVILRDHPELFRRASLQIAKLKKLSVDRSDEDSPAK
ncbi:MAG: hypothetical protein ACI92S_001496 [Planctomycetaceae bacterium]|jgi:hypothetical protein